MLATLYHFHSSAGVGITNRRTGRVSICLYNVLYPMLVPGVMVGRRQMNQNDRKFESGLVQWNIIIT
jgi:hypothetical protein